MARTNLTLAQIRLAGPGYRDAIDAMVNKLTDHDLALDALEEEEGGSVGPGTANKVAKFTSEDAIGDSTITDDGDTVWTPSVFAVTTDPTEPAQVDNYITLKANPAYNELSPYQIRYQRVVTTGSPDDSPNVAFHSEVIADECTGSVQNQENLVTGTVDCTALDRATYAGEFRATCERSSATGVLENIAILSNASGGDSNYSFRSLTGSLRNDGDCVLGTVLSARPIDHATNPGIEFAALAPITVLPDAGSYGEVRLGNNVKPYCIVPDTDIDERSWLGIGVTSLVGDGLGTQLQIKNTNTSAGGGGIHVMLDTTVNAGARGGLFITRGAGGSPTGNGGGVWMANTNDSPIGGAVANDLCFFNQNGGRALFGAKSTSTWQYTVAINNDGGVCIAQADQKVGFYGTAPIVKQTGVAVTAEAIHAALVALGLIGA